MHGHKTVDGKNIHAIHEILLRLPGGRRECEKNYVHD